MLMQFKCKHCGTLLQAGTNLAGQKGKCPKCNKEITVPQEGTGAENSEKQTAKKE
jgi:phage FluMu protein Com